MRVFRLFCRRAENYVQWCLDPFLELPFPTGGRYHLLEAYPFFLSAVQQVLQGPFPVLAPVHLQGLLEVFLLFEQVPLLLQPPMTPLG